MKNHIVLLFLLFIAANLSAQEHNSEKNAHELLHHKLFIQYGLVQVPAGHEEGHSDDKGIFIAAYGLGYSYRFNHKWSAAIEINLEGGNYLIHEDTKRENAFIIAVVAGYELMPRWGLFFGGGIEIEKHKNYAVVRLGVEYIIHLGKDWALAPALTFDHKVNYTSWEVALMLSKSF